MRIHSFIGLKSRSHHLLDSALAALGTKTPAELVDSEKVNGDGCNCEGFDYFGDCFGVGAHEGEGFWIEI